MGWGIFPKCIHLPTHEETLPPLPTIGLQPTRMLISLSLSVFVVVGEVPLQVCSPEGGAPEGVNPRVLPNS
jgi:hypothetical protein